MFKAGIWIPFEFEVADLLQAFRVASMHITPNSWKIIQKVLFIRKLLSGCVNFVGKGNTKLVDNLPDSFVMGKDSWGVPDRWEEKIFKPVFALATMSHLNTQAVLASSSSGVEKKKRRTRKRRHVLAEEELLRKEEADIRAVMILSPRKLPLLCLRLPWSLTIQEPSEGIPITVEKSWSVRSVFTDSPSLLENPSGSLFLEGAPQEIDLEDEGDPAPTSTSMGEPEPLAIEGDLAPTLIFMKEPKLPLRLGVLAATFREPSSSRSEEEIFWHPFNMEGREPSDAEGRGPAELMLRDLLPHIWEELRDLERWICFIDGCSLQIIGAGKCPEEKGVAQVSKEVLHPDPLPSFWECLTTTLSAALSEAQSRVEEEIETPHDRRGEALFLWAPGDRAEGLMCSGPGGEGGGRCEPLKEDAAGLLSNLVAARAERDATINSAEVAKAEALGLLVELVASKSKAETLHPRGINPDVDGTESHAELEVARREVSLLCGRVALLESREVELLSESEAAWSEVARLQVEFEASQAEMTCLRSGYVRALLDVVVFIPSIDLLPVY
ncbi:hypothetical protein ACLOJK_036775 [Asimina triloba]